MQKLIKGICIMGCLSFVLTSCNSLTVSDQKKTVASESETEQSMPAETEDVWGGYAQEHEDLVEKYPKWFNEQGEIVYPSPITDGDLYTGIDKREKANKLPREIIDTLDTRQLLEVTAEYPDLIRILSLDDGESVGTENGLYDVMSEGLQDLQQYTDAGVELMKREDLIPTCYQYYKDARLEDELLGKYNPDEDFYDAGDMEVLQARLKILLAEYVLCTEEVYEQLSEEEREAVVATAKRIQLALKKKLKSQGGYMFSFYLLDAYHFSALARSVNPLGLSPWQDLLIEADVDIYAYPPEKIIMDTGIQ